VLFVEEDLLVNVEVLKPRVVEEGSKQRVVLPYWLADVIAQKRDGAGEPALRKMAVAKKSENSDSGNAIMEE
jgi:hypothetical protein